MLSLPLYLANVLFFGQNIDFSKRPTIYKGE
jgi:hypothetical protein